MAKTASKPAKPRRPKKPVIFLGKEGNIPLKDILEAVRAVKAQREAKGKG